MQCFSALPNKKTKTKTKKNGLFLAPPPPPALVVLLLFLVVCSIRSTVTLALPNGFASEKVIQGLGFVTEIVFTPDSQYMFVATKFGKIYFLTHNGDYNYDDATRQMSLDLEEETCSNGERGLGSIALHPNFAQNANRWMYVYHAVPNDQGICDEDPVTGAKNLMVRYQVNADMTLDASSREILLESAPHLKFVHNGGRISFGKTDGYLYVTTGDGGNDDQSSQIYNLFGGIIRMTPDGDIPPTNPFVGQAGAVRCNQGGVTSQDQKCLELYAIGLRNPFKMDMDPNADTVRFMINDVGGSEWEEMSLGGEGVHQPGPKGIVDYGWPTYEGLCERGKSTDCGTSSQYAPPYHFYPHVNGGAAVGSAWIPNGIWPAEYDNGYLYADFVFGEINLVHDSGAAHCFDCNPAKTGKDITLFEAHDNVITMRFGPYRNSCGKALYYSSSCCGGQVYRIYYEGTDAPVTSCADNPAAAPTIAVPVTAIPTSAPTVLQLAETGGYPGPDFEWSTENCPDDIDYCGILEFCQDGDTYGFRLPCTSGNCECRGMFGPLIRLQTGNKYRFILRNVSPDPMTMTNIHPHGLHIVGDGDGDDVMRHVSGGGNCLDYTWDMRADHPGGTYWYHSHHHGTTQAQVEGGAFGLLIVEDNTMVNPDTPSWASNERILQIYHSDPKFFALGNGKHNEVIDIDANQWYRLRVSLVDSDAIPHDLVFHDEDGSAGCTIHKVANDGVWRSNIPGPTAMTWEMTGASRGDFAIRCTATNQLVPMTFNGLRVATIRLSNLSEPNPHVMAEWNPARPYSLRDLRNEVLPADNTFSVRLGYDYVNDVKWDPITPLTTIAYDQVHEWTILQSVQHPFHLHLYHMQVVQPGGCGAHEEGEFYDTISAPDDCLVRFATSDFGQRCILHCHVYFHEDIGSMSWVNVTGPGMPLNEVQSFEYECPAFLQAPTTPTPPTPTAATPAPLSPAPTTPEPTPTPCLPGFLGIQSGDAIGVVRGAPFVNEEYGVFAQQNSDGNFVVRQGLPENAGEVLWVSASAISGVRQDFHAVLEEDGSFVIYEDVPENRGGLHWTNGVSADALSRDGSGFFLGVDCTGSFVSVYRGSPENPGAAIWNSAPTNAPTMYPTRTPTISPTNLPTAEVVPAPPSSLSPASSPVANPLVDFEPTGDGESDSDGEDDDNKNFNPNPGGNIIASSLGGDERSSSFTSNKTIKLWSTVGALMFVLFLQSA